MADSAEAFQNRGPTVLAVTVAVWVVATAFVVLRLISRVGVVKKVTPDDYFIVFAWFIAFGFSFSICYGTSIGLGRHEVNVEPQWQDPLKKAEYAFSVLYNPALMATKTSICLFYLTLSRNQQVFKWATIATLGVVNVAGIALTFLNIFQCRPVGAAFEDPIPPGGHCTDIVTLYLSSAPVNIITDLALLFLPMPILTAMRLPRNEKLILIVTFSFGAFVAVVDVVRIAYLESAALTRLQDTTGSAHGNDEGDFSWIAALSFMWSAVEVHVGIICACVPGVKPLAAKVFPSLLGRITKHSHYHGQGDSPRTETSPRHTTMTPPNSPMHARHPTASHKDGEMDIMDFLSTPEGRYQPPPRRKEEEPEFDNMDFLTTPDSPATQTTTRQSLRIKPTNTNLTIDTMRSTRSASLTPFDFVNMNTTKSLVRMSNRESIAPILFVTILFFLWGFAYGLLDTLNSQFQLIVHTSRGQFVGLHAAYYGGYFVAPLTFGHFLFKRCGFKFTFIVGLCVYGCGTLVFWPSAVLASFPAFLISNFIVGLGVATLELAGNPFIALCGPPEHAEVRLNFSQGVQAIGTVVSPVLAKKVLFKTVLDAPSLIDVQWTYLGIALFVVILALIFFYVPLPEASDDELEHLALKHVAINTRKVCGFPVIYLTLALGVFSQFCYVGGQEAVSGQFQNYVAAVKPDSDIGPFNYLVVGHTVFAVGRFLSALAGLTIKPRRILLFLFMGLIISSALSTSLTGYSGVAMIVLVYFFESGIFSLIYAICLRGLGAQTKTGSVWLTVATSGGAVIPAIVSPVIRSRGVRYSFVVMVAVFSFGAILPAYLALSPAAKAQVDPHHRKKAVDSRDGKLPTPTRISRAFGVMARRKRVSSDLPCSEHGGNEREKEAG